MAREMACRKCKFVTTGKVCPVCKSSDLHQIGMELY